MAITCILGSLRFALPMTIKQIPQGKFFNSWENIANNKLKAESCISTVFSGFS
jgi:hypothetical protein